LLRVILFLSLALHLYALEVSLTGAKENFQNYSTLHLKDSSPFLCQEMKDDYQEVTQIICAFSKQPTKKFHKIQNDFFEISAQLKNKTFFLIIKPFHKIKLYPMAFNLSVEHEVYQADVSLSNHWMAIGYKEVLPYVKNHKKSEVSINFPVYMESDKFPYVGGLDLQGNPVYIKKVADVKEYLQLKKYYNEGKYESSLELIDEITQKYPDTLFKSEIAYYKMKVYDKMKEYESVIEVAKVYLKDFSSDENIAEVLSLTAKAYYKTNMDIDADYFFDRLFSEHADSPFAQWGYIYKGEMLEDSGGSSKAIVFYTKALEETQDVDIAVYAAYKLAKNKLSNAKAKEASEFIMKIINSKPSFFIQDLPSSMEAIESFVEESDFVTAAAIAKALLDVMDKQEETYEPLLKDRALWLCQTPNKKEALDALNEYRDKFKNGAFEEEIKIAKDALFFDDGDANLTTKLNHYNELIQNYGNDTIGSRALYEKAKLLLANKMFSDVLGLKESLSALDKDTFTDRDEMIQEAAVGVMMRALENKECQEVLRISAEYKIVLSSKWDDGLYECFIKGANYTAAKQIAKRNLKSKDLQERKKWLYRHINVDFSIGNYKQVIAAGKELVTLMQGEKQSPYRDIHRILFDTYQRVQDSTKMLETIVEIEKEYASDYKDMERYVAVMTIGSVTKNDNLVIKYGAQVMKIQKASASFAQSPFVEFTLYQSYINKEDVNAALEVIKSLNTLKLTPNQRARQKYLLGTTYSKLWKDEEAKQAYSDAIKADPESAWAKLAKDAKEI